MFLKKMMVVSVASIFLIGTFPVQAAPFGKSSSSSSSSRSSSFSSGSSSRSSFGSSPSRSSSSTSSNRGGLSQGTSLGMSRSSVANNVKSGNYSAPVNGTTVAGSNPGGNYANRSNSSGNSAGYNNGAYGGGYNGSNYNNGGYNNSPQQSQGHSTGTVVGAAAAGALAGYALGHHNSGSGMANNNGYNNNNTAYTNGAVNNNGVGNGSPIVDNNGNYTTAPRAMAPAQSSSGGFGSFIWSLIKFIFGLVVLYLIVRTIMSWWNNRNKNNSSSNNSSSLFPPAPVAAPSAMFNSKTPEDEIRDMKEDFFVQFQDKNRPSGLDHIRQNSTPLFFNEIEDMVRQQSDSRIVKVRQLEAELVDLTQEGTRYIASVRYHAVVSEGDSGNMQDTDLKELWNFVYENNRWKIAGIDQL